MHKTLLCPSAPADIASILLGVIKPDGSVAFLPEQIEVSREFLEVAAKGRTLESRFRFSTTCRAGACKQWANDECSLPARLANTPTQASAARGRETYIPKCSIRDQCRWFDQEGLAACRICPLVITRDDSSQQSESHQIWSA
jgi:hypothetical protein